MQVPYRKPGKFALLKPDPVMTKEKYAELEAKLARLKQVSRPKAAAEVARLAELGDFSENAEYQLAKAKLRGINNLILKLESQLINAEVVVKDKLSEVIQIGSVIEVECMGKRMTYTILGSTETDPSRGIISYHSPIGAALFGHRAGENITIKLANSEVSYKIISVK